MVCPYIIEVWKEIKALTSLKVVWSGMTMEEGLKYRCNNPLVEVFKALPLIVAWGVASQACQLV